MTSPTEGRRPLPPFNPLFPRFQENPYPFYRAYRAEDPVHWAGTPDHQGPGSWYLFRHSDVMAALRNPNLVRHSRILPPDPVGGLLAKWMLFRNPPDHTRLRSLVSKAFTPQMAERLQPAIQETADFLLDHVQSNKEMDLILHYASPLPLIVIAELLGIPSSDRDQLRQWTIDLVVAIDLAPSGDGLARAGRAALELTEYLRGIVAERRGGPPREDLISALITAEEQGDKLSEEELISMCVLLLGAGHETTVNLIGNGSLALLQHPDQWRRLRDDADCLETAVEELLRFDSPVQMTFREAAEDGEIAGKPLRRGELVAILLGAANRDPDQFPDPDRLDLTRKGSKHGAFGMGIHFCLGSHLARIEAQIAFRTLTRRMPELKLRGAVLERREGIAFRGVKSIPVTF